MCLFWVNPDSAYIELFCATVFTVKMVLATFPANWVILTIVTRYMCQALAKGPAQIVPVFARTRKMWVTLLLLPTGHFLVSQCGAA